MKEVEIYTDGACSGNPGRGGWAAVLLYKGQVKEISGYDPETTNQRMEMQAVVEGLKALKVRDWQVKVYTDSAYVVNAFEKGWIENWLGNGWVNSNKKPVANRDLWQAMINHMQDNQVKIIKVPGHHGVEWNERCDKLARQAIKDNSEVDAAEI